MSARFKLVRGQRRSAHERERGESFQTICGSSREVFESKRAIALVELTVPSIRLSASSVNSLVREQFTLVHLGRP